MQNDLIRCLEDSWYFPLKDIEWGIKREQQADPNNRKEVVGTVKEDQDRKYQSFVYRPAVDDSHQHVSFVFTLCGLKLFKESGYSYKRKQVEEYVLGANGDFAGQRAVGAEEGVFPRQEQFDHAWNNQPQVNVPSLLNQRPIEFSQLLKPSANDDHHLENDDVAEIDD